MNILLIEDDAFFQNFYGTKLRESGYTVDVASDGEEGLVKMRGKQYDLILLDLIMPKMDGFQVLESKGADETLKRIPVVIFSTLGQDQDIQKAKQLGANDYMNKSFTSYDELLNKIRTLVG